MDVIIYRYDDNTLIITIIKSYYNDNNDDDDNKQYLHLPDIEEIFTFYDEIIDEMAFLMINLFFRFVNPDYAEPR